MQKCGASFEWRALNLANGYGGFQPRIFWVIDPSFWKGPGSCSSLPGSEGMNCGFWALLEASLPWPYPAYRWQFGLCGICKTPGHPVLRRGQAWAGLEAARVSVSPGLAHRLVHQTTDICCLQFWRLFRLKGSHPRKPLSPGRLGQVVTLTEACQWPGGGWGEGRLMPTGLTIVPVLLLWTGETLWPWCHGSRTGSFSTSEPIRQVPAGRACCLPTGLQGDTIVGIPCSCLLGPRVNRRSPFSRFFSLSVPWFLLSLMGTFACCSFRQLLLGSLNCCKSLLWKQSPHSLIISTINIS